MKKYLNKINIISEKDLNRRKKIFFQLSIFCLPEWIELDLSNLDQTIDALEIVEIIDYIMVSMIVVTSNTGAYAAGTAGAGGAAG